MTRWTWALAVVALGAGCSEGPKTPQPKRAELRSLGGTTVEVVPQAGQLPYCLLYTLSEKGVVRQLTMTRENRSIKCDAGKPIANTSFRIPANEGKVRAYIIFSDDRIQAGPVAQQLYELKDHERISAMDMRLPGRVFVETLDYSPQPDSPPVTGGMVDSATGEVKTPPPTPAAGTQPEGAAPTPPPTTPTAAEGPR